MKKEIENQKEKINYLLELIKDNPNLKIIPMVSAEIVASDDFGYWAGEWGKSHIDEYWVNDERIYFKSTDYEELVDSLNELIAYQEGVLQEIIYKQGLQDGTNLKNILNIAG